jgi:hypothetical protein
MWWGFVRRFNSSILHEFVVLLYPPDEARFRQPMAFSLCRYQLCWSLPAATMFRFFRVPMLLRGSW